MAYLRELRVTCHQKGCKKQVVVEVIDNYNRSVGLRCRKHGEELLAEIKKEKP